MRVNHRPRQTVFVISAIASAFVNTSCYASITLNVTGGTVEMIAGDTSPKIFLFGNTSDGQPFNFSAGASSESDIPQNLTYRTGGPISMTFNSHSGDYGPFTLSIDGTEIPLQPYNAQSGPRRLKITGPLYATVPSVPGIIHVPVVFDPYTELDAPGNQPDNPPTYIISGMGSGVVEFVYIPSLIPDGLDLSRYTYYLGSSAPNLSIPEGSAFIIWSLLGMTACIFKSSRRR